MNRLKIIQLNIIQFVGISSLDILCCAFSLCRYLDKMKVIVLNFCPEEIIKYLLTDFNILYLAN